MTKRKNTHRADGRLQWPEAEQTKSAFRPRKPQEPGSVKEAVARLLGQIGGPAEAALRSGVNISTAYAWADEACEAGHIPFWRAAALSSPQATAAADYLAARCGGVFLPLPQGGDDALPPLTAEAAREFGELMARLIQALADGRLTARERRDCLAALNEVMLVLARLRAELQPNDEAQHG